MYKIQFVGYEKTDQLLELVHTFLQPDQFQIVPTGTPADAETMVFGRTAKGDRDAIKRELFAVLGQLTESRPDWGILTGIRPVKLAGQLVNRLGSREAARNALLETYCLSPEKAELTLSIWDRQQRLAGNPTPNTFGLYVGIPFCPTRCLYCSFASNQESYEEVERYLPALEQEITEVGAMARRQGLRAESLYVGGGTPTTLTAEDLDRLLCALTDAFDLSALREITVEGGRPDTLDREKLQVLKAHKVDRISINPQTMKEETLALIGRRHTTEDTRRAFAIAREVGGFSINADLIAGLPEETAAEFRHSLEEVLAMGADNVTVHALAVKRASRLKEADPNYHYRQWHLVRQMTEEARAMLAQNGFAPYYLYRQKHMAGAAENIGYGLADAFGLYNVRIMDEHQSVLALGAGGISKVYYPAEDRLERVANVTNYREYVTRTNEMIQRKREHFFREV